MADPIPVSTTETLPGRAIVEVVGIAHGSADAVAEVGRDIAAAFEALASGASAEKRAAKHATLREQAIARLREDAEGLGANAVVAMRLSSFGSAIVAYGTAVRIEPTPE